LKLLASGAVSAISCSAGAEPTVLSWAWPSAAGRKDPWDLVGEVSARIQAPQFSSREFNITQFGAVGDNKSDCTKAFRSAIAACHASGGGQVVVPEGEFISGPISLLSGVNLHVAERGIIRFSRDPREYPLVFTRFEGTELMNYSPFIYAFEQQNIGITGKGTIDGNADCQHWWAWAGRRNCGWKAGDPSAREDRILLQQMAERGVPVRERVFGEGHFLRPQFIQLYRCRNVLIEDVTLLNSPMWQVHPVLSSNITVRGLTIRSDGPNTDGCDPESCTDVLIKDCFFSTGDDCIAIKSGRNADGRRLNVPSQNILIQDCIMQEGHGGVTIGSEVSGGIRNIFAQNCRMDGSNLYDAVRIKTNAVRGGVIENVYARHLQARQVTMAGLSIDFYYEEGEKGEFPPEVRNVEIQDMAVERAKFALFLRGFKDAPIEKVRLANCTFAHVEELNVVENVKDVTLDQVRINGKFVKGEARFLQSDPHVPGGVHPLWAREAA
jgi:polygalacturonase